VEGRSVATFGACIAPVLGGDPRTINLVPAIEEWSERTGTLVLTNNLVLSERTETLEMLVF
jgi:hypothetical protein